MDTHFAGRWFGRLRPLIAAFFLVLLAALSGQALAGVTCTDRASAMEQCKAQRDQWLSVNPNKQIDQNCIETTNTNSAGVQSGGVFKLSSDWGTYAYEYTCTVTQDPPPDNGLCGSAASFDGWINYSGGAVGVVCKEGCAFAATEGESGSNEAGQQRYVGTFTPMGRSCTSTEDSQSDTPHLGDPPPDPPSSSTTANPPSSSSSGGTGTGSGNGNGSGTGTNPPSSSSSGGTGTGNGGNGTGTGGNGTGGNGTGTGGNGTGGSGTGGNGTGTGNGGSGTTNPPSSSSSGGTKDGTYSGDACDAPPNCTGDAVMCGVATESHKSRCAIEKAFSAKDDLPTPGKDLTQADLVGPDVDVGKDFTPDQAGLGLASTCPFKAIESDADDMSFSVDISFVCDEALGFRAWIMALAALACYFVMVGNTNGRIL